jgi:hypothetical protein
MSPIQATALGVRLFVVWAALYFGRGAPAYYLQFRRDGDTVAGLISLAVLAVVLVVLAFLWLFPRSVARTLLPPGDHVRLDALPEDRWLAIGCALLGLWVVADAVPGIVQQLYAAWYASRAHVGETAGFVSDILYYVAELLVALWLLFGSRGFARMWHRVRAREPD